MTPTVIGGLGSRERSGVIGLAVFIVITVGVYLAVKSSVLESTGTGRLLPYQALVRTLPSSDQTMFGDLQKQSLEIEQTRAARGRWPDAAALNIQSVGRTVQSAGRTLSGPPTMYKWTDAREGFFLNYLATPVEDASAAAWLLVVQEPDPQAPVDQAPNDETHHRLPDGTVLHVTLWTHRFGGQVAPGFVRQPEGSGWTQVLTAPVATVAPRRN